GPHGGCQSGRRSRQGNYRTRRPAGYEPVAPFPGGDAHSPRGCRSLIRRRSGRLPGADLGACQRHRRWSGERFWPSPQGRICREFDGYPLVAKYLRSVHFDPLVVRGEESPWPTGQPWIFVEPRGGSYSPDTALPAMTGILDQKIRHYGRFARPTRLVIHYGKAAAYNTPYVGIETREFADVGRAAADAVRGQEAFENIYLLNALEPAVEAYEIYPNFVRCA